MVIASKLKYHRTGKGRLKTLLRKDLAFTTIELLVVLGIIGILAALTLPAATTAVKNYRLHSDASAIGGFLNVTRMKAASQYTPYALDIDPTATPAIFRIEQLASNTYNPLSPTAGSYASLSPPAYDQATGTQQTSSDTTVAACRPAGISVYPGAVTADPTTCSGAFQVCFNTRGAPVLCSAAGASAGKPLTNGGLAVYLTGTNGLTDAVTIDVGGVAQVWNWSPSSSQWFLR